MKILQKFVGNIPISAKSVYSDNKKTGSHDLLFIHMSWGGSWVFKNYWEFFTKAGYNCHILDLRGHGESGGTVEGVTMDDYVQDVFTVVKNLDLIAPVIIGHSMGGLIALMYSSKHDSVGTISLDGSTTLEVQKTSEEKQYPLSYTSQDSGMPKNPLKAMCLLPDISLWTLMKMKKKLGVESGVARSDRKRGISVPKESLNQPLLFIGAEKGTSLPFGIGIEKMRASAIYYNAPIVEIKGASHPGLLIGKYWKKTAQAILKWLEENNL